MFDSPQLKSFLERSHTVRSTPKVFAEVNLNAMENINKIGVYRYRPNGSDVRYRSLPVSFDRQDIGDHYTDAEISYAEIGGTYESGTELSEQISFRQEDSRLSDLFSLEDCFRQNRPRSGINKLLYLGKSQFIDGSSNNPAKRPRFYIASKDDYFKYWTSYKREGANERGISYRVGSTYPIDDAVPFVVYNNPVPANRIVVKMQTLVGEESRGRVMHNGSYIDDPLYGPENMTVPQSWTVQVLRNGAWSNAYSWTGATQIPVDGHVELGYGIVLPSNYSNNYLYRGELVSTTLLPENAAEGDLYLVKNNDGDEGDFWIASSFEGSTTWLTFKPEYGWSPENSGFGGQSRVATNLVNPPSFGSPLSYREFQMIEGLRIIVRTMNRPDATFDLIELSPRLVMDWTDRSSSFDVTKSMADLSGEAVPVGRLMASTGSLSVSNNDSAFNVNNVFDPVTGRGSIIAGLQTTRTKVSFYENILNADGYDYYIPIKTLYTETTPSINNEFTDISISLRDLYFLFESMAAPSLLMTDVSLSRAVMTLMDYIGFSNYSFRRKEGQIDPIIPYFFIAEGKNVAEVMMELAMATQTAMYLDEYNNLIVATKEYMMPDAGERSSDFVLRGNDDGELLANIRAVSSADRKVYNAGSIDFTKRYIQRTYGSLNQAMYQPQDKTWIYAPTLVWEVGGDETTKALNENAVDQSTYTLSAMPLASSLSKSVPTVIGGAVVNNTIDVGEAANYIARYNGYLYANGEIIRYDAVQYAVTGSGNVWIRNSNEYQNYLLGLPFNGRMYPTGLIRIWTDLYYTSLSDGSAVIQSGDVKSHGRGQFGTKITSHEAGLADHWTNNSNVHGILQNAEPLFNMREDADYQSGLIQGVVAGKRRGNIVADALSVQSTRNGIIKHNLSQKFWSESDVNRMTAPKAGTLQSSAFVFAGPEYPVDANPRDHVSYVSKKLDNHYTNFGTRCRIIGKIEAGSSTDQNPIGSSPYFSVPSTNPTSQANISGGSGGIGIHVNPSTNAGYFFEIAALTSADPSSYEIPETETETLLGNIVYVSVTDNVVKLSIDQAGLKTIPSLSLYDVISVEGVYESDSPPVTGIFRVEGIESNGLELTYILPTVAYTWVGSFGTLLNNSVNVGTITAASIDINNVMSISVATPTGIEVGSTVTVAEFDSGGSIPKVNTTEAKVLTVSSDGRTVTVQIPKENHTFAAESLSSSTVKKVVTKNAKLSNLWFYKTVSDDLGGRIVSYTRTATQTEVTVDNHRLSRGDFVTIKMPTNYDMMNGEYQVTYIVGNVITLNRGGGSASRTFSDSGPNTIGLTNPVCTTYKLWSGLTNVLVDSGQFWGQYRSMAEENTTVYDLGVEYVDSSYGRTFYLYINNRQVATVVDKNPLQKFDHMALFVRGKSKLMFENVYAMGENIANSGVAKQITPGKISDIFGIPDGINQSEALRKYAVSGFVQSAYLSGISNQASPQYNMYYDEFGTIMREAAYFNIAYDQAFPALYAKLAPTLNRIKGYSVSGFYAGAYGAEFMVFNCLDNLCSLDPSTGNYLRINGVVFTQSSTRSLTVDNFVKDISSKDSGIIENDPNRQKQLYDEIKMSRAQFGKSEFRIASDYIQSDDTANDLMKWIIGKTLKPKKNIGIDIFPTPILQLGDIVSISYNNSDGAPVIAPEGTQFVVYQIETGKSEGDATMKVYATEI